MLRTSLIAAAFAFTLGGCVTAASTPTQVAAAENTQPAPEPGSPEEVICEKSLKTGSRFPTERCLTRATWEKQRQDSKDAVAGQQRRALNGCIGAGCSGG